MSFESNNYVVIIQQALLFSPLMHLFRNHCCLGTRGADAQQELCCLGEPLTLRFLLCLICLVTLTPLDKVKISLVSHGLPPMLPPDNRLCMAKLIWLHRPSSRACVVLDTGRPWHSFVAASQSTYPCACISSCLPEGLLWCLASREYKTQEAEDVLTG